MLRIVGNQKRSGKSPPMKFPLLTKSGLYFIALLYLLFGFMFMIDPGKYGLSLGFTELNAAALVELRAVYGGLELAMGFAMIWLMRKNRYRQCAALSQFSFIAFAGGRILGLIIEGAVPGNQIYFLVLELSLLLISWFCWKNTLTEGEKSEQV